MPAPIPVELHPYTPAWRELANAEIARLHHAFGTNVVAIHHIGSTSIPGIHAKPIIDLMPEVLHLAPLDDPESTLPALGYALWGEYGIAGRRYCTLDDPQTGKRRIQLHCFEQGHEAIARHLAFRDYLIANPEIAREYDAEKQRCRHLHPNDSHAYTDAKAEWIAAHLPAALEHYSLVSHINCAVCEISPFAHPFDRLIAISARFTDWRSNRILP